MKEGHRAGKRREELTGSFKVSVLEFVLLALLSFAKAFTAWSRQTHGCTDV